MKPTVISKTRRSAVGFTLVELLVVIVIIGALAAVVLPMARSMRSRADITKCSANLRTWSLVIRAYADDHNALVRYQEWEDIGSDPTKKVYFPYFGEGMVPWPNGKMGVPVGLHRMCPAQHWDGVGQSPPRGYLFVRGNQLNDSGKYAAIKTDSNGDGLDDGVYNLTKMANPSQFLMMMDANNYKNIYRTSELTQYVKPVCINADTTQIRHDGGVNALFADGHIDFLKWSDIDPLVPENTQKVTTWLNLN